MLRRSLHCIVRMFKKKTCLLTRTGSFKPQSKGWVDISYKCEFKIMKNHPAEKMAAWKTSFISYRKISYFFGWIAKWPRHSSIATLFLGVFADARRTPCLKWWHWKSPRCFDVFVHVLGKKSPCFAVSATLNTIYIDVFFMDYWCLLLFIIS